ncbi:hypothetical protein L596_028061 [Steinernema carpocapsae]|uniref:Uncharacterized protein n=1 Tax=Steinernema carpocapsae TaxID=34508 RepID=A0A4U5LXC6_STECR|nr:hypothetical protein L596_028061 [Steinernema carpocapsae]
MVGGTRAAATETKQQQQQHPQTPEEGRRSDAAAGPQHDSQHVDSCTFVCRGDEPGAARVRTLLRICPGPF